MQTSLIYKPQSGWQKVGGTSVHDKLTTMFISLSLIILIMKTFQWWGDVDPQFIIRPLILCLFLSKIQNYIQQIKSKLNFSTHKTLKGTHGYDLLVCTIYWLLYCGNHVFLTFLTNTGVCSEFFIIFSLNHFSLCEYILGLSLHNFISIFDLRKYYCQLGHWVIQNQHRSC